MNVKEGLRRLGLLLGVSSAIFGCVTAYPQARNAWETYSAHRRFEAAMRSKTMQNVADAALRYAQELQKEPWKADPRADKFGFTEVIELEYFAADKHIGPRKLEIIDSRPLTDADVARLPA